MYAPSVCDLHVLLQLEWLNAYHSRVRREVGAVITSQGGPEARQALSWLQRKTKPITNSMHKVRHAER